MQKEFKEYYEYSNSQVKAIWENAVFIFDTNILHGLYRMNEKTRDDFLKILNKLRKENRIWTPYQVLKEYHKNRRPVIIGLEKNYQDAINTITGFSTSFSSKFKDKLKSACENHPLLNTDDVYSKVETSLNSITEEITKIKSSHPKWRENDTILKKIEKIFDNFGEGYSEEDMKIAILEGEKRFKIKTPPGYADDKANGGEKEGDERFGDLIIWKQILDYSKTIDKPIIFVTDDTKEDWWIIEYEKPFSPRHELKKEIKDTDFEMYTSDNFLTLASEQFKEKIGKESIREVRRIRNLTEERDLIIRNRLRTPFFRDFLMRQNKLRHRLTYLAEDLKLSKEIVYEIRDYQERIINLMKMISRENHIHPGTMSEFLRIDDRLQSRILLYIKSGKISKQASRELFRYLEENTQSLRRLMKYSEIDPEYYERFHIKMRRNQNSLSEFMDNLDE